MLYFLAFATALVNTLSFYNGPYMSGLYVLKFTVFVIELGYGLWCSIRHSFRRGVMVTSSVLTRGSIWCVHLLLTTVWSQSPVDGVVTTVSYFLLCIFAFWVLPRSLATEIERQKFLTFTVSGLVCALMLSMMFSIKDGSLYYVNQPDGRVRYTLGLLNANNTASFAFAALSGSFALFVTGKRRFWWLMLVSAVAIWKSDSRTAVLAAVLLIVLYGLQRVGSRIEPRARIIGIGVLGFVVVGSLLTTGFLAADYLRSMIVEPLRGRLQLWQSVFEDASLFQWLFGSGIGGAIHRHNYFVNSFEAGGLLSIVLLCAFLHAVWKSLREVQPSSRRAFVTSLFLAWLTYSMTESILITAGNIASIYVWCEIGMASAQPQNRTRDMDVP